MSQIETVVRIYHSDTKYWDISSMITKVDIMYGRNQPFMYQELEANKLYFNSLDAYWNANADQNTPRDQGGNILLPSDNIVDGQTRIFIQAYGQAYTLLLERHESTDDIISLICYNSAYYLQSSGSLKKATTIHIESGTPYLYGIGPMHDVGDKYALTSSQELGYYHFTFTDPVDSSYTISLRSTIKAFDNTVGKIYRKGDKVYYSGSFYVCVQTTGSTSTSPQTPSSSATAWSLEGEITPLYIEATGTDLFKFFSFIVANYSGYVVDDGYSYDYTLIGTSISSTYTLQQVETLKNSQTIQNNDRYKIRVDNNYSCWEIIKSIGAQSNRWPFFYDYAYFVDYSSPSTYRDDIVQMDIDYGVDDDGLSKTRYTRDGTDYEYLNLYSIVKNADQGSEYVQTSQKIFQETYNATVSISDQVNSSEGYPLYFPYPESDPTNPSAINNTLRNQAIRKIALNRVVQNYKPSDAVQIQYSEVKDAIGIDPIGTYSSAQELPTTGVSSGDYAIVIEDNIFQVYYEYDGTTWSQVDTGDVIQSTYEQKFQPYTVIAEVDDAQNGLKLSNVPLACVEILWPNCITQATFGNPEFMDAQKQWKSLSLESQISTIEGSEGSLISDRYASKLVIGNQNMSDLQDNREGFTGLIMEKNYDNDLYRLSGYNEGRLQAYFNSQGEIMSGDGTVIINENGITIGSSPGTVITIQEWDSDKDYLTGTLVMYNGKTYISIAPSTGANPETSPNYWQQLTYEQVSSSVPQWQQQTSYSIGDMVLYQDKTYISIVNSNTYTPGTDETKWQQLTYEEVETKVPLWQAGTYSAGQMVRYNNYTYISLVDNNVQTPGTDDTKWQQLTFEETSTNVPTWTQGTYNTGQLVLYNGITYVSLVDNNSSTPGADANWSVLTYDTSSIQVWSQTKTYATGDQVVWNTKVYKALKQVPANKDPSLAQNSEYWENTSSTNLWSSYNTYMPGDTVLHNNYLYVAKTTTGTNYNKEPGTTAGESYWQPSLLNTTNLSGDIIAQNNTIKSTASGGRTIIDADGLKTYNSSGTQVCSVGTDGQIQGLKISASQITSGYISSDRINTSSLSAQTIEANQITVNNGKITASQIDATGLTVGYATSQGSANSASSASYATSQGSASSASSQTTATNTRRVGMTSQTRGYVEIDEYGLRTYSSSSTHGSSQLQCKVGTDGAITQGQIGSYGETVRLDTDGVSIHYPSTSTGGSSYIQTQALNFYQTWGNNNLLGWVGQGAQNPYILGSSAALGVYSDSMPICIGTGDSSVRIAGSRIYLQNNLLDQYIIDSYQSSSTSYTTSRWYVVYSNGLIIQGGRYTGSTSAGTTQVSFTKIFPTCCLYAQCSSMRYNAGADGNDYVSGSSSSSTIVSTSSMYCRHEGGQGFYWIAIGY